MATTLTNLFYIARRLVGTDLAMRGVAECLRAFDVIPVDGVILTDATQLPGSDYEDNVAISCAVSSGMDLIVTRNLGDFTHSRVPAVSTGELLQRLATSTS